jgi:hypothetical protein
MGIQAMLKSKLELRKNKLLSMVKRKKPQITRKRADEINRNGAIAQTILEEELGKPFRDWLDLLIRSSEEQVLNVSIREQHVEGLIDGIKSIFIHTKEEQLGELQSKYRVLIDIRSKLEEDLKIKAQLEEAIEQELVEIVEEINA